MMGKADRENRIVRQCVHCGKKFARVFMPFCDDCDHMTDIVYDLDTVELYQSQNPYERFRDLLPIENANLLPTDLRFTPTIHAKNLGKVLGMQWLYLKNETVLPTRSTKDRMAAVSLAYLYESGVRRFVTSSTGNSSTAYAQAINQFPEMTLFLFTASDFCHRVHFELTKQVVHFVLQDATFVDAFNFAHQFAKRHNLVPERGFFNPGRREGLKLAWFEAVDQIDSPIDWYVQAISSAMGVYGTYKGARELLQLGRIDRLPHLLCVQQESCSPMVAAWDDDSEHIRAEHIVSRPSGIADAILRGDPTRTYPYIRQIVKDSGGEFSKVSETEIREAQRMAEELEGVSPCFSASTALAGLIKLVRDGSFPRNDTVLVNLTGGDRDGTATNSHAHRLIQAGNLWIPQGSNDERPIPMWSCK